MTRTASKKIKKKRAIRKEEIPLMVWTNDELGAPRKGAMLEMIYRSVERYELAYVDAKDPDTGEIVPMLCAVEPTGVGNQVSLWPLARIFNKQTDIIKAYGVPDGQGGWLGESGETEARPTEEVGTE